MFKPRILLLTNPGNDQGGEDEYLRQFLNANFAVTLAHPFDCDLFEDAADLVLIRNIWPTAPHQVECEKIWQRLNTKNKITYSLSGHGDRVGKTYLVELYQQGYPVVPSVVSVENLDQLPPTSTYFIKPIQGGDAVGTKKLSRSELIKLKPQDYIIQPYYAFAAELSFFFIDQVFQHALYTPDVNKRWELSPYTPTPTELAAAKQFTRWNKMRHGIERIDLGRTADGQLLLIEIEDYCPYLSLLETPLELRENFLNNLRISLAATLNKD